MEVDLQIYSYDNLGQTGGADDLAALLDEGDGDLDALTFGLDDDGGDTFDEGVGKDFDFAGSTNAFLGTTGAQQAGLKPISSGWLDPTSASSAAASTTTPSGRAMSPWTGLDDDPLLGRRGSSAAAAAPVQQSQGKYKTLEEVEAELRAQRATAPAAPPPAAKTLEEVEAEMLRARQQQPQAPPPMERPVPQVPTQQTQQQPLPPGMSPQLGAAFPPGVQPPPHFMGIPPQFAAHFGIPPHYPPHLLPPHIRAQLHAFLQTQPPQAAPSPIPQQQFIPGHSRPGSLVGGAQSPAPSPAIRQTLPPQQPQQIPGQQPGFPQPPSGPPTPGAGFPPLGAHAHHASKGSVDLMATLFPPLGSAPPAPGSLEQVEARLAHLSVSKHQQHPSLTGAQLTTLLQQARAAVTAPAVEGEEAEQEQRKKRAEEMVHKVEDQLRQFEIDEQKRQRREAKIMGMAKHNNLMSTSDKDFITRIQVSQLVTDDPYADDFYFHIISAIRASRGLMPGMPGPAGPGIGGPDVPGQPQGGRRNRGRENAMNRMAQNVQRLVDSAKKRNERGGGVGSTLSLDGALGKIATRTRSAPRPLLQVKPSTSAVPTASASSTTVPMSKSSSGDAPASGAQGPSTGQSLLKGAGLITSIPGAGAPVVGDDSTSAGVPLSYRATLSIVEKLYDYILDLEQLRRIQPQLRANAAGLQAQIEAMVDGEVRVGVEGRLEEAEEAVREGVKKEEELRERLWRELRVMEPLDGCTPHPFVSLLSITKGKRILPRVIRHLTPEQTLTLLTLLVATFSTLDVVKDSPLLDVLPSSAPNAAAQRKQVEEKTEALLSAVVPSVMAVVGQAPLRMVTGMLGLLMDRNDLFAVVRSKPGLAFLTILLSRAEGIKQAAIATPFTEPDQQAQYEADLETWNRTFTHLFAVLSSPMPANPSPLLILFPSTRLLSTLPFGYLTSTPSAVLGASSLRPGQEADNDDEPVWRFLAAVAVCAGPEQQQGLVMGVRDKVVENVRAARAVEGGKVKGVGIEVAAGKIRNVNLLLHALSLDASMIETDE